MAASLSAPFPVLPLVVVVVAVAVALAVVVTLVAVLAGEATTLAVVELVVEAEVMDVEDGVEDALRELCPVDGRLKIIHVKQNQSFTIKFLLIIKSVQA